ncbi:BON domain-containing protein [Rhodoferax sp.]|uniref:BON domain-containing protein n=1 Tax=Rhodoferax sp. TaxID=50421 RepID=UPI00374D9334
MTKEYKSLFASALLACALLPGAIGTSMAADAAAPKMADAKRAAMTGEESALATSAVDAVKAVLADDAKNVMATARGTTVTLVGWVNEPSQESAARKAASKVPGVKKVYSKLHVWSTDTH